jgi:DNA-directed RNA polymerase subunit RPC12/RpoP
MIKIICLKCKYEWESKSDLLFVTCPSCLNKVKINEKGVENEKN